MSSHVLSRVAERLALAALSVFLVSVTVFISVEVLPQDVAVAALGHESTEEQRAAFRRAQGLDRPAVERYVEWSTGMLRGDFGTSVISGRNIWEIIVPRFRNSAILAVTSLIISVVIAIPLAISAARRAGRQSDLLASTWAMALSSIPEYVLGIVLLVVFAGILEWLPVVSTGISEGQLRALVLPSLTLGLAAAAYTFRFARVSIIETLSASYIRAAVLRGLSPRRIIWYHVMPNAGIVIISAISLNAILLLGGVITVEAVFGYPGLGTLVVSAINTKDLPLIEGVVVVYALLVIAINVTTEITVRLLNPRLRTG